MNISKILSNFTRAYRYNSNAKDMIAVNLFAEREVEAGNFLNKRCDYHF